jgi:hypothetical protein
MIAEIPAALAALNNLKNLVGALTDAKAKASLREHTVELNFAIIEAQNAVIAMQSQYQSLLSEKDELKKELMERENWDAQTEKYELVQIVPGITAYALKTEYKGSTPPHWLCPACYHQRKQSILQREYNKIFHKHLFSCPNDLCKLRLEVGSGILPN